MIFIYSVAANTQNTYIWLKLYHLWSSYVWDVSGKSKCNTFLFCCGCRWEFLFDEQLIFSRCCRIIALQVGLDVLQVWVLGVLQIYSPDSRQLSLRFFPLHFEENWTDLMKSFARDFLTFIPVTVQYYCFTGKKDRFLENPLCLTFYVRLKVESKMAFVAWDACVGRVDLSCLWVCRGWNQNCGKILCPDTGTDCTWTRMGTDANNSPSIYPTLFLLFLHISEHRLLLLWLLLY